MLNFINQTYYWDSYNLVTTAESRNVRTVVTAIFWITTTLITLIGTFFLKRRNQRKLLRGREKTVPLHHLSSWLSDVNALTYFVNTRRLPGGLYGILMLLTGLIALLGHFFVSRYIFTLQLTSRCRFSSGIRVPNATIDLSKIAVPDWPAANLAQAAQLISSTNGGTVGIYSNAASDTNFTATVEDTLSAWNCYDQMRDSTHQATLNDTSILAQLQRDHHQYTSADWIFSSYWTIPDRSEMVAWSASSNGYDGKPWTVKASIAALIEQNSPIITMRNFYCNLTDLRDYPAPNATWMLGGIDANKTLSDWGQKLLASLKDAQPETVGTITSQTLNTIFMTAGTGNVIRKANDSAADYGCLQALTVIQYPIWIVLGVILLIFVPMLLVDLVILLLTCFNPNRRHVLAIPNGLTSWQLAGLRSQFREPDIKESDIHKYTFGWLEDSDMVGFKVKTAFDVRTTP